MSQVSNRHPRTILYSSSSKVVGSIEYTFGFRCLLKNKSTCVRSGDQAGYSTLPLMQIQCIGKRSFKNCVTQTSKWEGAPSCWHVIPFSSRFSSFSKILYSYDRHILAIDLPSFLWSMSMCFHHQMSIHITSVTTFMSIYFTSPRESFVSIKFI